MLGILLGAAFAQDSTELQLVAVHGLPELSSLLYSPDGGRVYAAGTDDLVRVFDAHDLTLQDTFGRRGARMDHLALSPDGHVVAAGDRDGAVTLFDAWTGEELYRFGGNGRPVIGLAWSDDGATLGIASLHGPIRLVDAKSGRPLQTIQTPGEWLSRAAFHLETGQAAGTGRDGHVRIWDLRSGIVVQTLEVGAVETTQLAFSPSGKRIAGGDWDGRVRVWNVDDGRMIARISGAGRTGGLVFTDEDRLIGRGADDAPMVWNLETGGHANWEPPPRWTGLPPGEDTKVDSDGVHQRNDAAHDPVNNRVAEAYGDTLRVWDLQTGEELASRDTGHAAVRSVALSPDGSLLAVADASGSVRIHESLMGGVVAHLELHDGPARSVDFSPDGEQLVIAGPDHNVRVWAPRSGTPVTVLYGHEAPPTQVLYLREPWSTGPDGRVIRWDGSTPRGFHAHDSGVAWMAVAPDGRIATWPLADDPVRAWFQTGEVSFKSALEHPGGYGDFAGTGLASATSDELAILDGWTGGRRGLSPSATRLEALDASPDGRLLAGGTSGGSVHVLDARSGQLHVSLRGHAARVGTVAWSDDGQILASGADDGTVRVWTR